LLGVIPESLERIIEEEARRRGSTPEALTVQLLLQIAPAEERWRILLDAAKTLISHAREHARRGEYAEACRRLWSSVLLCFDAYASLANVKQPGSLHDYVKLAEEAGGEEAEFLDAFYAGVASFILWREGVGSPVHCERIAWHAERLAGIVEQLASTLKR